MTNSKTTERALLTSILALITCLVMLLGTTFAWFTDSVTSSGNKIQSGNLKVDLELLDKETGVWNSVKDSEAPIFNYNLWEPGYTDVKVLKVQNEGSLALKWKATFVSDEDLGILADVIDVYVKENVTAYPEARTDLDSWTKVGTVRDFVNTLETTTTGELSAQTEETLGIALKMQESAGNEYQDEILGEFDITILATQLTEEDDSFDNQYDKDAFYPGEIADEAQLKTALAAGGNYKLTGDIDATELLTVGDGVEVNLDLNGMTLTGDIIAPNADLTITNGTINDDTGANSAIEINAGKLYLDDVTIISDRHPIRIDGEVTVVIDGGTYKVTGEEKLTTHAINISGNANVTINGGTFVGLRGTPNGSAMGGATVNVQSGATVVINGGDFSGGVNNTLSSKGTLTVYGGTFDQDPSAYVADGYKAVEFNDAYMVIPQSAGVAKDDDTLATAISEGATTVILGSGTYNMPSAAKGKTLTFTGTGDTTVAIAPAGQGEAGGQLDYNLDGSTVTFNNITIKTNNKTYAGYARLNATYNNCTFENQYCLNGTSEFNDCTFNVSGDVYNIWTWGAPTATFTGCTFNSDGKAMLLYGTVDTKLTLNNCVFNDNGGLTDLKAAVEIGNDYGKSYELIVNNTVVNGYEINDKGINTGTTLWANKNSMSTDKLNVVVDGVDVY